MISKWSLQKPEDKFFFCPHSTQGDTDLTDTDNSTFENDGLDDDIDEIRPKQTPKSQNNLLFCYQSEQQQRLLARYGSICLLDATYRTTRYALPLFFLCVRTNVGYQVVGVFMVQQEDIESIKEALTIFQEWNSQWMPKNFMVDFADEEIQAIESVFPGTINYLLTIALSNLAIPPLVPNFENCIVQISGNKLNINSYFIFQEVMCFSVIFIEKKLGVNG